MSLTSATQKIIYTYFMSESYPNISEQNLQVKKERLISYITKEFHSLIMSNRNQVSIGEISLITNRLISIEICSKSRSYSEDIYSVIIRTSSVPKNIFDIAIVKNIELTVSEVPEVISEYADLLLGK